MPASPSRCSTTMPIPRRPSFMLRSTCRTRPWQDPRLERTIRLLSKCPRLRHGLAPQRRITRRVMTIVLNHTIVPARDKAAAARFFAELFGLRCEPVEYFAPVRVNDQTTLLFSDEDPEFESHHYAFHV